MQQLGAPSLRDLDPDGAAGLDLHFENGKFRTRAMKRIDGEKPP